MPDFIITKIERQKHARHRVSIFIDNEFAFGLNDEVVYRFNLAKGEAQNEDTIKQIREYDDFLEAKNSALRFLSRRKHSAFELKQKLMKNKFNSGVIDQMIDHLKSINLLDDLEFAKAFVRDRLNFKPSGRRSLMNELKKRGIAEQTALQVLNENLSDNNEEQSARAIAEKYLLRLKRFDADTQKRRLFGYLMRKGYASSMINSIITDMNLNQSSIEIE